MKIVLVFYIALQAAKYLLELVNLRYLALRIDDVPPEFIGIVDRELLKRTEKYTEETGRFSLVTSLCSNVFVVIFMFCGVLDWYNSVIHSINLPFIAAGWLFVMLLHLANEIISVPFSLYHTFRIENRYGFNTSTFRLWLSDLFKSLIISVVLLSIVSVAALALVTVSPAHWWFWIWLFLLLFSLFVIYISPSVIDPLFNRFVPLEDDELVREIYDLVEKAGVRISKVLKMDASKRSRHSNAYFSGIGKTKRIVLFDTLLESMEHSEITAVLAHEIRHWKKRHVVKTLIAMQAISFAVFYGGFRLINSGSLTHLFDITQPTFYADVVIAAFLASMALFFLTPVLNRFSRHFERESDRYACDLSGNGEALITALVKLSKENLSNPYPHPLYAAVYYSHPPVLERVKDIKRYTENV